MNPPITPDEGKIIKLTSLLQSMKLHVTKEDSIVYVYAAEDSGLSHQSQPLLLSFLHVIKRFSGRQKVQFPAKVSNLFEILLKHADENPLIDSIEHTARRNSPHEFWFCALVLHTESFQHHLVLSAAEGKNSSIDNVERISSQEQLDKFCGQKTKEILSSCQFLLALTMSVLTKIIGLSYLYLNNTGRIPACICYSRAALANGLQPWISSKIDANNILWALHAYNKIDQQDQFLKAYQQEYQEKNHGALAAWKPIDSQNCILLDGQLGRRSYVMMFLTGEFNHRKEM